MKIGTIGIFDGDLIRIIGVDQLGYLVESLDNPRIKPFIVRQWEIRVIHQ